DSHETDALLRPERSAVRPEADPGARAGVRPERRLADARLAGAGGGGGDAVGGAEGVWRGRPAGARAAPAVRGAGAGIARRCPDPDAAGFGRRADRRGGRGAEARRDAAPVREE